MQDKKPGFLALRPWGAVSCHLNVKVSKEGLLSKTHRLGLASWYNGLNRYLWCWHSHIRVLVPIPATLLQNRFCANVPGKAVDGSPSIWGPASMWKTQVEFWILALTLSGPGRCSHLEKETVHWKSLSLSLYLSNK